jgi:enoyl-CoA hydratase
MNYSTIKYEKSDGVAVLTLCRPERVNAINRTMLGEIQAVLDAVEADAEVRVLVVTGEGSAFSSGFDLKEQMEARPQGFDAWREILRDDFDPVARFWSLSKPTIAAVRGACLASGCELALCCDITIAAENAVFGEPELKFGAGIVVMMLPWITGPKQAKEIIFNGLDNVSALEALRLGIVNRVVPNGTDLAAAMTMARHIAVIDPGLVRQTKQAINRAYQIMGMEEALEAALAIDLAIEGPGSPDKQAFMDIARRDGLRAAITWRDARFAAKPGK